MILVALVVVLVVLVIFPTIRCALLHPFLMVWNSGKDVWFYFRHKEYNRCPSGELIAYCGLFGKGKTLSAVHKAVGAPAGKSWLPRGGDFEAPAEHPGAQHGGHFETLQTVEADEAQGESEVTWRGPRRTALAARGPLPLL